MFESIMKFFKKLNKKEEKETNHSREAAKERLHLVLMQDRANVSADFLELMKQEIIEVIKKYIDVDEEAIDVRLTNQENEEGTNGAPALYANIPIVNIKNEARKVDKTEEKKVKDKEKKKEDKNKDKEKVQEKKENDRKVEEIEDEEEPEIVEEIQNERIAKVILEGKKYNEKKDDKKKKSNEKVEAQKEEKEDTNKEQQKEETPEKEEKIDDTKEEKLKSED